MTDGQGGAGPDPCGSGPVLVVSSDTHIGPRPEQLRPYCPARLLDEFDRDTEEHGRRSARMRVQLELAEEGLARRDNRAPQAESMEQQMRSNRRTAGHNDVLARLEDMDRDGVAAGVIFEGSQNGCTLPFSDFERAFRGMLPVPGRESAEAEGIRIYNRWLADFCTTAPERHVPLCKLPIWDVAASIAEIEWASAHGFRGVHFPANTAGLPAFEDPSWEPLFACCSERAMPLVTHISGAEQLSQEYAGRGTWGIRAVESTWLARRPMWLLTFTGAFERHAGLRLVLTEVPGAWWDATVREMDAAYFSWHGRRSLHGFLPRKPSEYVADHVWVGSSFQSREEATSAVEAGAADRMMWGSDYPHTEGTWLYSEDPDEPSVTRLSLANTFHGLDEAAVRRMAGLNAVECFGLDAAALKAVAERVGPSPHEMLSPADLSLVPERYQGYGFRTLGAWS